MDMNNFNLITHDKRITELIEDTDHKILAQWAIDCLNHQRCLLNPKHTTETKIINTALETLQSWMNDEISMWEARKYCWTVLEAARNIEKEDKVACQLLRATSHTLATCHVYTHSEGSAMYVISALEHFYKNDSRKIEIMTLEREWQISKLINLKAQT